MIQTVKGKTSKLSHKSLLVPITIFLRSNYVDFLKSLIYHVFILERFSQFILLVLLWFFEISGRIKYGVGFFSIINKKIIKTRQKACRRIKCVFFFKENKKKDRKTKKEPSNYSNAFYFL